MADPFVAEIRMFTGNFAPTGWAFCNGQILPLSQNTALFALLGTTYGGDGESTFALPNIQGRAPMFWGQGPGLSNHDLGEPGGQQNVTLDQSTMPAHAHNLFDSRPATNSAPTGANILAVANTNVYAPAADLEPMADQQAGGGQPHNNMQPFLALSFIIALQGIFPPRN